MAEWVRRENANRFTVLFDSNSDGRTNIIRSSSDAGRLEGCGGADPTEGCSRARGGWVGFACKQQGSRETLSKGHLIQSLDRRTLRHRNEVRSYKNLSGRVGWGYWFCWYSVWFDVVHIHHSGTQPADKCMRGQTYFFTAYVAAHLVTLGKYHKLCRHQKWI